MSSSPNIKSQSSPLPFQMSALEGGGGVGKTVERGDMSLLGRVIVAPPAYFLPLFLDSSLTIYGPTLSCWLLWSTSYWEAGVLGISTTYTMVGFGSSTVNCNASLKYCSHTAVFPLLFRSHLDHIALLILPSHLQLVMLVPSNAIGNSIQFSQFSCSVVSNSLQPNGLQCTRPPCPSPTPGVHSDSHPSSQ